MLTHPGGPSLMPMSLRTPPRDFARVQREDAVDDSIDVPAAVVCAICGDSACGGCESDKSRSGIVALVAWERPGAPMARLWATARAATITGEAFFEFMPDGPIAPALRFAVVTELFAAMGFVASSLLLALAVAPSWVAHLLGDSIARHLIARVALVGVPSLALLLVACHAAYGLALDHGARGAGGRVDARSRALRFGLYTSGWDLVLGPIGAVVLAIKEGLASSASLLVLGVGLPARCARAFLRGCHRLEGLAAEKARASSTAAAVVATLVGAVAILAAAVALVIATG